MQQRLKGLSKELKQKDTFPFRNMDMIFSKTCISISSNSVTWAWGFKLLIFSLFIFHLNLSWMWNNIKTLHERQFRGNLTSFFFLNALLFFPLHNIMVHVIITSLLTEKSKCKFIISASESILASRNKQPYLISASSNSCQNVFQSNFILAVTF